MKMKLIIGTLIISIVLVYVGLICHGNLISMLLPRVGNVGYMTTTMTGQFSNSLWFGILLGLVPVVILLTWITTKTIDYQGKFLSIGLVLAFMLAALAIRYFMIKAMAVKLDQVSNTIGSDIQTYIDMKDVKYNLYLLVGQVGGFLVTLFVLKNRKNRETAKIGHVNANR